MPDGLPALERCASRSERESAVASKVSAFWPQGCQRMLRFPRNAGSVYDVHVAQDYERASRQSRVDLLWANSR